MSDVEDSEPNGDPARELPGTDVQVGNDPHASLSLQPAHAPLPGRGGRRLLVIAYYFPPMGLSGVQRIAKFTRHLPDFGWQPTVLTVRDVAYFAHDHALLDEVLAAGVEIERTKTLDPLRLLRRKGTIKMPRDRNRRFLSGLTHTFLQPDNKIGWKRYAVKHALALARREPFDAILATAPPFTDFLIGRELQSKLGIPLVVDYRDPWLDNRNYFFATPLHRGYAARLEQSVLKSAEGIVVVNRKIKEQLIARYPFLTHEGVHIIPSGFDEGDFSRASVAPDSERTRFRITFSGHFDAGRTPIPFFKALARVFAEHPETRGAIEACFIGTFPDSFRKAAVKLGVAEALAPTGYLEHREVVGRLVASDLLWLTVNDPTITPGKLFEYIGSGKPILALAPVGVVRQVLKGYGASTCVQPDDVEAIAGAIYRYFLLWQSDSLPQGSASVAAGYEQRRLTETLARILAYSLKI